MSDNKICKFLYSSSRIKQTAKLNYTVSYLTSAGTIIINVHSIILFDWPSWQNNQKVHFRKQCLTMCSARFQEMYVVLLAAAVIKCDTMYTHYDYSTTTEVWYNVILDHCSIVKFASRIEPFYTQGKIGNHIFWISFFCFRN